MFPSFPDEVVVRLSSSATPWYEQVITLLSPFAVAAVALVGVLWQSSRARTAQLDAEKARDEFAHANDLRRERREVQMSALFATAEAVRMLEKFNRSMSGNPGKGKADRESAATLEKWAESTEGIDTLSNAALAVEVLGSHWVAESIDNVRDRIIAYVAILEPPIFKGAHANEVEADLKELMYKLTEAIREDLGVDVRLPGA